MADDIETDDGSVQTEEDQSQPSWKAAGHKYTDLQGNEISPAQFQQQQNQVRQLAQQHAQQFAQQELLRKHPEIRAKIMEYQEKSQIDNLYLQKKYTDQQRMEYNQRHSALNKMKSNPSFSDEEKVAYERMVALQDGNMKPTDFMQSKPYPKGRAPGDDFIDPNSGDHVHIGMDGNKKILSHFEKTKEGLSMSAKHKLDEDNLKHKREQEKFVWELRKEFSKMKTEPNPTTGELPRYLNSQEINDKIQSVMGVKKPDEENSQAKVDEMRKAAGLQPMKSDPKAAAAVAAQHSQAGTQTIHLDRSDPDKHYNTLAPGTVFIGPDGQLHQKPIGQQQPPAGQAAEE